ncbi:BioY protein [Chondrocystis sp. NIES-4102]|nr:BioY protein [Chondrocystis sp. NIES-4102]
MSDLKDLPKPNSEISNYEWDTTPLTVKAMIEQQRQLLRQKQQNLDSLQQENKWLRDQLDLRLDKPNRAYVPLLPEVLLWAAIGLILTVGGTFIPASAIAAPWSWWAEGLGVQTLGVSYQIGAVLFTACVGGRNAALLSQIAYVSLGLAGLPLFTNGGGLNYLQQPNFGYLVGFIFGAWLCGWLAHQTLVKFSSLVASCLAGLMVIHLVGIIYLTIMYYTTGLGAEINSLFQAIAIYTIEPLPGQLAVICAISSIAFVLRKLMFS